MATLLLLLSNSPASKVMLTKLLCLLPSCAPIPTMSSNQKLQGPLQYLDVYVDEFLGLVQGNKHH